MRTRRTWRGRTPEPRTRTLRARPVLARAAGLLRGRRGAWTGAGVLLVVGVLVAVWAFGGDEETPTPPDSRARQYREFDACLLTGESGITGGDAAAVWRGMRRASDATRVRVTHVPVMGEQSAANALPHLDGLIQRDCEMVLATGAAQTEAVRDRAKDRPRTRFVVIGTEKGEQDVNETRLTVVKPGDGLADEVDAVVRQAVKDAHP
ncbi:BMP family ABC transporter substrate-binding protein [Streptomyces sp. NPDC001478]